MLRRGYFAWAVTSFLSAFLLFMVQPMATKAILPILGGSPSVWNTAMVCFQLLLLGGYAYAHALTRIRIGRNQWLLHGAILAISLLQLPLTFDHLATTDAVNNPSFWTLTTLLLAVGMPFFCLAATAPLLQHWVTRSHTPLSTEPYRLYSVSNLGSMIALIGYIVCIEPLFDLHEQHLLWSILYFAFTLLILYVGYDQRNMRTIHDGEDHAPHIPMFQRLQWVFIAFIPSSLMLGVTTYLSTDIASMPLLWVIPLVIYLLSFIAAFGPRANFCRIAARHSYILLICFAISWSGYGLANFMLVLHLVGLAIAAFALHGKLAERKPDPRNLTQFYLCLSLGGVLGGMFNALLAPLIFTGTTEYPLMLAIAACTIFLSDRASMSRLLRHGWILCLLIIGTVISTMIAVQFVPALSSHIDLSFVAFSILLCLLTLRWIPNPETKSLVRLMTGVIPVTGYLIVNIVLTASVQNDTLITVRNFFGTVRVIKDNKTDAHVIYYNTTVHGNQPHTTREHPQLDAYYNNSIINIMRPMLSKDKPFAVIGLGAGTVQCLAAPKQHVDYYDINPAVIDIAENPEYFTYLNKCPGSHTSIAGDGRLMIARAPDKKYGAVFIDAFSSDAIPIHLLTTEALDIYRSKLADDGFLLFHVTNRFFELSPLLALQAKTLGWHALTRSYTVDLAPGPVYHSSWVVLAPTRERLAPLLNDSNEWREPTPISTNPWTDAYSNILPYLDLMR